MINLIGPFYTGMIVGLFIGGTFGFFAAALCAISGRCSDDELFWPCEKEDNNDEK